MLVESEQVKLGWERSARMPDIDREGSDTGFQHQLSWRKAVIPLWTWGFLTVPNAVLKLPKGGIALHRCRDVALGDTV